VCCVIVVCVRYVRGMCVWDVRALRYRVCVWDVGALSVWDVA